MPVYKTERYLREAIESVLVQTYSDLDVILIDDGSPDGCGRICDEFARKDPRVRVFHNENKGVAYEKEFGIVRAREAGSGYVLFFDSDDRIDPDMIGQLVNAAREHNADIVVCGFTADYVNCSSTYKFEDRVYDGKQAMAAFFRREFNMILPNKLVRSELWDGVTFPESGTYEDVATSFKLFAKADKVVSISHIGYHYRQRKNSVSHSGSVSNLIDFFRAASDLYAFFLKSEHNAEKECHSKMLHYCSIPVDLIWTMRGKNARAERHARKEELDEIASFVRQYYARDVYKMMSFRRGIVIRLARHANRVSFALAIALTTFVGLFKKKQVLYE
jgi:glycosyltransferase involved in cell wall biosynthesis